MAKESIKARERKRAKMVAKYAAKRAALKEIVRTGEPEDVEKAVIALEKHRRTPARSVSTIAASSPAVRKVTCVNLVSRVSTSVRWLFPVLSLA